MRGYLSKVSDPAGIVKSLAATVSYRRSLFSILPRDLRRTGWSQDLMYRLRQRGISDDLFGSQIFGGGDRGPNHPSPLIRTLARSSFIFERAADVFTARYLMERVEANGLEFPSSVRDFATRLNREIGKDTPDGEESDEA